ncbi:hypothetical protein T07_13840 [Trichinella nelsoni]|uniref:Uncharacterized protein n=1 Tax=Trichinella nelsoni TaxID=6336 RepID=A0A0V0S339_9BILA|nr:hypothetical protein T07_13840 [Trichinella nelsoni]
MSDGVPLNSKPGVDPPVATMSDWHTLSPPGDLYRPDVKGQHRESVEVMQPTAVVEGDVVVGESSGEEQAAASEIGALSEEPQKMRKKNTERRKEKLLSSFPGGGTILPGRTDAPFGRHRVGWSLCERSSV